MVYSRRMPSRLRPGVIAASSGVYRVHHHEHRLPHMVFIEAGTTLPECNHCGIQVQFSPLTAAEAIATDEDFHKELKAAV